MPSEITDIKTFLEIARRKDAKAARIKRAPHPKATASSKGHQDIKFKLRAKRYVYTLKLNDASKADKIKQSLPPNMKVQEIGKKNKKPKKT